MRQIERSARGGCAEQPDGLLSVVVEALDRSALQRCVEMSVDLFEQAPPRVEPQRADFVREGQVGNTELRRTGVAVNQPGISLVAEEPSVLSRPRKVAVVPNVFGKHDRWRQAVSRRSQRAHDRVCARPQVRSFRGRALGIERHMRRAGQHLIAARRVRVVAGDDRSQHGDLVGEHRSLRHQFADEQSGSLRRDRAERTTNLRRSIRLCVPCFVLRCSARQPEQDYRFRFPECRCRSLVRSASRSRGVLRRQQMCERKSSRPQAARTNPLASVDAVAQ